MSNNPLIFQQSHPFPPSYNEQQLHLLQYNTAYFNPYEVKHRKRTSRAQLTVLEAAFQQNNKPSSAVKKNLAAQLDMPIRNVQVWFQNRRAKDKNLALKAKAKAEQESAEVAAGGKDSNDASGSEGEKGINATPSPKHANTFAAASDSPPSHLTPPSTLALRRGSAPTLGLPSPPQTAHSTNFQPPTSSPQNTRSLSDITRSALSTTAPTSLNTSPSAVLSRRKSLPAFHPAHQDNLRPSQLTAPLPTVLDTSPVADGPNFLASAANLHQPLLDSTGHGGVYRSMSSSRTGVAPYPLPARGSPNHSYRSGSTPGIGVFRVPANPNPSIPSGWGAHRSSADDLSGGLTASLGPYDSQPYTFPPRQYADVPNAGPLPSKDFRFGDSSVTSQNSVVADDDDERLRALAQSHRFGSLTSELSVESDATGTTATTATSSTGISPLANGPLFNAFRLSGGVHPQYGHANNEYGLGASISYGVGSGSVAGLPGMGSPPIHFPAKFDPDLRRASCPAHLTEHLSLLHVNGNVTSDGMQNAAQVPGHVVTPSVHRPLGIRKSLSGIGLAKSPLSMSIQVPHNSYTSATQGPPQTVEENENEPLTAIAGEYSSGFGSHNFSIGISESSVGSASTSRQASGSPEIHTNGFSRMPSSSSSFDDNGLSTPSKSADESADVGGPIYMTNFTQEPAFDASTFFYGSQPASQAGSQVHLPLDPQTSTHLEQQQKSYGFSEAGVDFGFHTAPGYHNTYHEQSQQAFYTPPQTQSAAFPPHLHAPTPKMPSSSSSLAGALQSAPL
ncbi:hypothetical protein FRB99_005820 [Tulasnella sp. 403]|nr:hypothetical protein FRB99_005820 [Tulasnella sp. 403]